MVGLVGDIIADGIPRITDVHAMEEMRDSAILEKRQMKHVALVANEHLDQLKLQVPVLRTEMMKNRHLFIRILTTTWHRLRQLIPILCLNRNQLKMTQ